MASTAGSAMGSRRGLGRVKHIDTVFLWVQEVIGSGRVSVGKQGTKEMLADILTKPMSQPVLRQMIQGLGFEFQDGKHELGLNA